MLAESVEVKSEQIYLQLVDSVFEKIPSSEKDIAILASLESLLVLNGEMDFGFHENFLDREVKGIAEDWLKTHPDSRSASEIAEAGLRVSTRFHLVLAAEINLFNNP
jgi:hypothetical protein